ncbi:hypothetical protein [Pseudomonas sp. GM74]|nr:hypothetical protein [Pseudomonas sp. GM74]
MDFTGVSKELEVIGEDLNGLIRVHEQFDSARLIELNVGAPLKDFC